MQASKGIIALAKYALHCGGSVAGNGSLNLAPFSRCDSHAIQNAMIEIVSCDFVVFAFLVCAVGRHEQ